MQISGTKTLPLDWQGDALVLGFFESDLELPENWASLNERLANTLQELIEETEFTGKANSKAITRVGSGSNIRKIAIVGLGKASDFKPSVLRNVGAAIARLAAADKIKTLAVSLPSTVGASDLSAQLLAEGIILALHKDNRFKSDPEDKEPILEKVELLGRGDVREAIATAEIVCSGVILARELVNAPANSLTPIAMADVAKSIAADCGLELKILEREDCERLGMGSFLGVAQASELPPKFIHLTYKPQGTPTRKVAIVGKSLTFDSGGLNIKVSGSGIETMKMDMGGGAATLGAAKAIAQLKPAAEVHFICPATENMISGKAMHPGDILTASNGKTIEVNNTDAEGRLTLADALVYAEKLGVDAIVDLATLTGACIVALGDDIAGLWSTEDKLTADIEAAADTAGEKFWKMPLEEPYFEGMKSKIADMKNTGPRAGGSITAALFLKQFVKETPWAHLDIAGPVWEEKGNSINNAGGTGFPVRTLVNWVLSLT